MKTLPNLIEEVFSALKSSEELPSLVAFDSIPAETELPEDYVVFNIETGASIPAETKSLLTSYTVKFYLRGYNRYEMAEEIKSLLDGKIISSFKANYLGINTIDNEAISLRINFI